ncbi:MAG: uL30 family ribosomal protein [Candidatus Pacearchaeota archaeon]
MIAIIRIAGMVNMREETENTLSRLRLRRKYVCVIVDETKEEMKGILKKIRDFTAYGNIDDETLKELIEKRGQLINKKGKIDAGRISKEILTKKTMNNLEIKPFFRLHPPRGGINSKQHFPRGVLGNHKEKINDLIRRML